MTIHIYSDGVAGSWSLQWDGPGTATVITDGAHPKVLLPGESCDFTAEFTQS